jgi:GDP-mannose transporter
MSSEKGDYRVVIEDKDANAPSPATSNSSVVAPSIFKLSPGARAALPIISYCTASILMTVTNKYVVSGYDFNMNFLLLAIQVSFYFICG